MLTTPTPTHSFKHTHTDTRTHTHPPSVSLSPSPALTCSLSLSLYLSLSLSLNRYLPVVSIGAVYYSARTKYIKYLALALDIALFLFCCMLVATHLLCLPNPSYTVLPDGMCVFGTSCFSVMC